MWIRKDWNHVTAMFWVSSVDWITPVAIKINPLTWRVLVEVSWGWTWDMLSSVYDPAEIKEQLVWETASQTLENKTINTADNTIDVNYSDVNTENWIWTPKADLIDLQKTFDHVWSTWVTHDCEITDHWNWTVSIWDWTGVIRASEDPHSTLYPVNITAQWPISLTDDATNYISLDYNSWSPQFIVSTDITSFNCLDTCIAYVIHRDLNSLNIIDAREQNVDSNRKSRRLFLKFSKFIHAQWWTVISEKTSLDIAVTAGDFFFMLEALPHDAYDTSVAWTANANVFDLYYRDWGTGFTKVDDQKVIDPSVYDGDTGTPIALSNNTKYWVTWFYLAHNWPTRLVAVMGQEEYANQADAEAANPPWEVPSIVAWMWSLIWFTVASKIATSFDNELSAFAQSFTASAATSHNALAWLDWWEAWYYWHLSNSAQSITWDKTFNDSVIITWDLTVNWTTTSINTTDLEVEDKNITVNHWWNDASSEWAWLTIERTWTDGSIIYADALISKFKIWALWAEKEVVDVSSAQTLENKTLTDASVNWVTLTNWWAATDFLNAEWDYVDAWWGWGDTVNFEILSADKTLVDWDDVIQMLDPNGSNRTITMPVWVEWMRFRITNNDDNNTSANIMFIKDNWWWTLDLIYAWNSCYITFDWAEWQSVNWLWWWESDNRLNVGLWFYVQWFDKWTALGSYSKWFTSWVWVWYSASWQAYWVALWVSTSWYNHWIAIWYQSISSWNSNSYSWAIGWKFKNDKDNYIAFSRWTGTTDTTSKRIWLDFTETNKVALEINESTSAPTTTTDKLYNVGWALTWNWTDLTAWGWVSALFSAYTTTSSAQWTASWIDLIFQAEDFDDDSVYNISTWVFTAPSAWKYQFSINFKYVWNTTGDQMVLQITKNGSSYQKITSLAAANSSFTTTLIIDLALNDTVNLKWLNLTATRWQMYYQESRFQWYKVA